MKNNTIIHWDGYEEKLHMDLNLKKSEILKADMYDAKGKCIEHVFEKLCKAGFNKIEKKIKITSNGYYLLKISSPDSGCHVIRFSVN